MKSLIVYSSKTGNTRQVGEAILQVMPQPCDIFPVEQAPDASGYDFVVLGFWVDKGAPDQKAIQYIENLEGVQLGLFGTLGAYPDSDHARECIERAYDLCQGNTVHGCFLCQGKIDPNILAFMRKHATEAHPMTPEREARIREAEKHPDEEDFAKAREAVNAMLQKARATGVPC